MSLRLSGGRRLQSPPGSVARPTPSRVRQAVMNMLAPHVAGSRWLDLCCGSGAMACEALQHGAAAVVAVERDRRIAAVARANLEAVRSGLPTPPSVIVHQRDVIAWLSGPGKPEADRFDLIYADPPYRAGLYGPIAAAVAMGDWLGPNGLLILECATDAIPAIPDDWEAWQERRYGGTTVLLLRVRDQAGCLDPESGVKVQDLAEEIRTTTTIEGGMARNASASKWVPLDLHRAVIIETNTGQS